MQLFGFSCLKQNGIDASEDQLDDFVVFLIKFRYLSAFELLKQLLSLLLANRPVFLQFLLLVLQVEFVFSGLVQQFVEQAEVDVEQTRAD